MIITITQLELQFLEETLETVLDEFDGFEECSDPSDYTLTTGAVGMAREALSMIKAIVKQLEAGGNGDFD